MPPRTGGDLPAAPRPVRRRASGQPAEGVCRRSGPQKVADGRMWTPEAGGGIETGASAYFLLRRRPPKLSQPRRWNTATSTKTMAMHMQVTSG